MKLSQNSLTLRGCAVAASVALSLSLSSARADVVSSAWSSPTNYTYEIAHMPDFDQRRQAGGGVSGLPNDGGMYCVPTSYMNMFAYAGNHGFPAVAPGNMSAWWQSQSNYELVTNNLELLGGFMGTSPTGGTGGTDAFNGGKLWLLVTGTSGKLVLNQYSIWAGISPITPTSSITRHPARSFPSVSAGGTSLRMARRPSRSVRVPAAIASRSGNCSAPAAVTCWPALILLMIRTMTRIQTGA